MNLRTVVILTGLLIQSVQADPLGDEVAGLKVRFPEGKHLSSNELRQVVELAHHAGMTWVTEIRPLRWARGTLAVQPGFPRSHGWNTDFTRMRRESGFALKHRDPTSQAPEKYQTPNSCPLLLVTARLTTPEEDRRFRLEEH